MKNFYVEVNCKFEIKANNEKEARAIAVDKILSDGYEFDVKCYEEV